MHDPRATLLLLLPLLAAQVTAGMAQSISPPPASVLPPASVADPRQSEKAARQAELSQIEARLAANVQARQRLEAEIAGIRADRAKLNAALIETTAKTQGVEGRVGALEARLTTLTGSETAIRGSLEARRGLIADVLGALQRMGRRAPPAVLVRPEDMLEAVRASILLGAVLPELRQEVETLALDLAELVRLRDQIAADRASITAEMTSLAAERQRLASLLEARREREAVAGRDIEAERQQASSLAEQARSLRDFVERIEKEIASSSRMAEDARKALESQSREARERMAALAFRDPARLQPKIAFGEARGLLPMPVSGQVMRGFGAADGQGAAQSVARGMLMSSRSAALVSAPADAWVAYAGPYRSFGQLLILNAGGGYYILLAGMKRLDVTIGQFILTGEPVGVMGETRDATAVWSGLFAEPSPRPGANDDPVLYIEFRKDGVSIDPGPWWAKTDDRKVRG